MVMAIEVDDKPASAVQTVLPVFTGPLDSNKPRFIITARALEDSTSDELHTETEPETTENTTDETDESISQDHLSSSATENNLDISTSAGSFPTELTSTISNDEQSLVARTGEIADDASAVSQDFSQIFSISIYEFSYFEL